MKIVNIKGGLGNQMFQYAFAYKLKKLQPTEQVLFDLKDFRGYEWHEYELKSVFDIDLPIASFLQLIKLTSPFSSNISFGRIVRFIFKILGLRRKEYTERDQFEFHRDALHIKSSCYYDGYWACPKYFEDIRDELLNIFSFRRELDETNRVLLDEIQSTNSVSIHVRRGNYLLFDIYKGICELDYYQRAIDYFNTHVENPHFYIFSNDIEWCKDSLSSLLNNYTFVDVNKGGKNYIDLQLMASCKHNIIANSTFSWWGAWLNNNSRKIVIRPYKWLNNCVETPCPKEWIAL